MTQQRTKTISKSLQKDMKALALEEKSELTLRDKEIIELTDSFIQRYRKDLEELAKK